MSGRVIDATLRFVDHFTSPMQKSLSAMTNGSKNAIKLGKDIEKAGSQITSVGSSLTAKATVPILGLGAGAIKTAADFEKSMSQVAATMGTTSDQITGLTELAQKMGRETAFSASEAADGINTLAMAGLNEAQINDALETTLNLAAAGNLDLASSATYVTGAVKGFGDEMSNASKYADMIAKGATMANTDVNMLGAALTATSATASSYGQSADTATASLLRLAEQNVTGEAAATMLNRTMGDLYTPTASAAQALDKLGVSAYDESGKARDLTVVMDELQGALAGYSEEEANAYKNAIFTTNGLQGFNKMMASSTEKVQGFYDGLAGSGGSAANQAATQLDNLSGQLTLLKSATEGVAISFGNKLLPYVKSGVQFAQNLADKINNLSDEQMDMIIKIGGFVAAAGPAIMIFGKMVSVVGKGVRIFNTVRRAISIAGGAMSLLASPVGIAIAVVAGLIAVVVLMIKHWDKVKATAQKVWGYISGVFNGVGKSSKSMGKQFDGIRAQINKFIASAKQMWTVIGPTVKKIGDIFKLVFKVYIGAAIGAAIGIIKNAVSTIMNIVSNIIQIFQGIVDFITGVFTGNWSQAWEGVKEIFGGVFGALVEMAKMPINAVISIINGAIEGINGLGLEIPDWVPLIGGQSFSIDIPTIPTLAHGTSDWQGGIAQVSERGGEIIDLPSGSRVYPAAETKKILEEKAGGVTFQIAKLADELVVREDADIDKIADALARKLQKVASNMGGEPA